jgi:lipoprotein-anchoring transpeptidase ErfK/SrfK
MPWGPEGRLCVSAATVLGKMPQRQAWPTIAGCSTESGQLLDIMCGSIQPVARIEMNGSYDKSNNENNPGAFSRRALLLGGMAVGLAACTPNDGMQYASAFVSTGLRDPRLRRQRVQYNTRERPGTIVVDTGARFLYFVEEDGWATRYGVGVGREGANFRGRATIRHKAEWPSWTPTENMMRRDPRLREFASGVPGGPNNPLGARALYLFRNGRDTMFRLHGTNEPQSIGMAMSSGCIRLMNEDVIHLYSRTPIGTPVVVI